MKRFNKLILVGAVAMMAVLLVGCGEATQEEEIQSVVEQAPPTSQYPQYGYYGQPNFYGYSGFNCNGVSPVQIQGTYPDVGALLNGNPDAMVRYGDQCFYVRELNDMYGRYSNGLGYQQTPWHLFGNSPYGSFQLYANPSNSYGSGYNSPYGQAGGSYDYQNSTHIHSEWTGFDDYMGYPGFNDNSTPWYFNFNLSW